MKLVAATLALSLASSALFADDAEGDGAPVTPVIPVETVPVASVSPVQTVWTIKPVSVELLRALTDSAPDPQTIKAIVAQMTPESIAGVVVSISGNPSALSALVAQLTPEQLQWVAVALSGNSLALSALASTMTPEQAAQVSLRLLDNPVALKAVVSKMSADKLVAMRVELFLTDIDAWAKFTDLLSAEPARNAKIVGGTGLDGARARVRALINKEGYSPAALAEARAIMKRLKPAQ